MPEHDKFYVVTFDQSSEFRYFKTWKNAFEFLCSKFPWREVYDLKFDTTSREARWFFPEMGAITELHFMD